MMSAILKASRIRRTPSHHPGRHFLAKALIRNGKHMESALSTSSLSTTKVFATNTHPRHLCHRPAPHPSTSSRPIDIHIILIRSLALENAGRHSIHNTSSSPTFAIPITLRLSTYAHPCVDHRECDGNLSRRTTRGAERWTSPPKHNCACNDSRQEQGPRAGSWRWDCT